MIESGYLHALCLHVRNLNGISNGILLYSTGNYGWSLVREHDNVLEKRMHTCMRDWITLLCSRKLMEHCKPAIMEKIKIIIKKRNLNWV